MRVRWTAVWIGIVGVGCAGSDDPTLAPDPEPAGACGDYHETDVQIVGRVTTADGTPVEGADIWLEERNWAPGTVHGSGTADAQGAYTFDATTLPIIEDCWGTAVDFWLVGEAPGLFGDKPMNPPIINAWNDGSLVVDAETFPLILDPAR